MQKPLLYTIGHSNRSIQEFLELLEAHGIKKVIDIRTIPKSRHNPQFNQPELRNSLKRGHVRYAYMKKLGGLRHAHKDSINDGWTNTSFRGFADYMQTDDFSDGLQRLEKEARKQPIAIMCAEAVPWRCHRFKQITDGTAMREQKSPRIRGDFMMLRFYDDVIRSRRWQRQTKCQDVKTALALSLFRHALQR